MANLSGGTMIIGKKYPVKTPFRPPLIKSSSFATTIGEFGKNSSVLNDLLMKTPITRNIRTTLDRLDTINQQLDSKIQSIEDYLQIPIERNNNMDGGRRTTRSNKKSIKSGGDLAEGIMGSAEDVASKPLLPPESPVEPFTAPFTPPFTAPFTPPPKPDPPTPAPISSYGPPADYIVQSYKVIGGDKKPIVHGSPVSCKSMFKGTKAGTASIISSKTGTTVSVVEPNGATHAGFTPSACISSPPTLKTPPPSSVSDLVTIMKSISQDSAATSEVNTMILGPMTYFKDVQIPLSAAEENSARFLNRLNFIAEKIKRLANVENKIKEICVTSTLDTYGAPQVKLPPVVKNPFTKVMAKPVLSRPSDWWGGKRTRSKRHSKRSSMKKRK